MNCKRKLPRLCRGSFITSMTACGRGRGQSFFLCAGILEGMLSYEWDNQLKKVNEVDKRKSWEQAASVIPEQRWNSLCALGTNRLDEMEELRLRRSFP